MAKLGSASSPVEEVHWEKTAVPAPKCAVLSGEVTADVVIVGGGLTGLRAALGLAEAGMKVAVLEANSIGWGASGRSGGQCNPIWRETPDEIAVRFGDARAARLIETTLNSADALFNDIRRFEIDCDGVQNGWLQAAHCRSAQKNLERLGAAWNAVGAKIEFLDRTKLVAASGSPEYSFALRHPNGGHVQPLSLTRGYARAAQELGASLFDRSSALGIARQGNKWKIRSAGGSVVADQVILTTNAYTTGLWPNLQQTFMPMVSIAVATEPLPPELQASILPDKVTISDSRLAIYFARYDRDGRLIFGCVGSTDKVGALGGHSRLRRGLHTVFPQLARIAIERTWAGRIAVTPEMMPHLHEPAKGLLAALGFSGRGIAITSVMGRTLAKKVLGAEENELPFPVSPISPIPFHGTLRRFIPLAAPAMAVKDRLDKLTNRA